MLIYVAEVEDPRAMPIEGDATLEMETAATVSPYTGAAVSAICLHQGRIRRRFYAAAGSCLHAALGGRRAVKVIVEHLDATSYRLLGT